LQSAARHFQKFDVVLVPDKDAAEYWAGAPSVARDAAGVFWLAARMRSPEYARGLRGYEIRLLRSTNGVHFERVNSIRREDVPIPGFERPALLFDPATKKFKLYACGPWKGGPWAIIKFDDADSPEKINAATARPVIQAPTPRYERDATVAEYKDPVVIHSEGRYHCYVTGYIRKNERIFHYTTSSTLLHYTPLRKRLLDQAASRGKPSCARARRFHKWAAVPRRSPLPRHPTSPTACCRSDP